MRSAERKVLFRKIVREHEQRVGRTSARPCRPPPTPTAVSLSPHRPKAEPKLHLQTTSALGRQTALIHTSAPPHSPTAPPLPRPPPSPWKTISPEAIATQNNGGQGAPPLSSTKSNKVIDDLAYLCSQGWSPSSLDNNNIFIRSFLLYIIIRSILLHILYYCDGLL
jgi:hypothetical protein